MKKFIIIDGIDGSGKDVQAQILYDKYNENGDKVVLRSHPENDNTYGKKAKEALLTNKKICYFKIVVYYALDVLRSLHLYYDNVDVLIFSRYSLACSYLPLSLGKIIYRILYIILPHSSYMFLLDLDPETSFKRINKRLSEEEEIELFENKNSLKKVREKYLILAKEWHVIDAEQSIEKVHEDINYFLELD